MAQAPRQSFRLWRPLARGAGVAFGLWLAASGAAGADGIAGAEYSRPVDRYHHDILGDVPEWGALRLRLRGGAVREIVLPETQIFEDIAPRLADLDGDGAPEVIAVQTSLSQGARLTVWGAEGQLLAATPYIGRSNRWLSPIGAADLDGDGAIEIAYIDRPHLAKLLRIWRYQDGKLLHVVDHAGLSNHKIGWGFIPGGIRKCAGQPPELITASGDWRQVVASRLQGGQVQSVAVGPFRGPESVDAALRCP